MTAALLSGCASGPGAASSAGYPWQTIYPGIDFIAITALSGSARLALHALRIDLDEPGLDVVATPGNGAEPLETTAQTTPRFLEEHGLAVAVNAMFFAPCCEPVAEPKDVFGLAVSEGSLVSPRVEEGTGAVILAFPVHGRARVVEGVDDLDVMALDTAVSGSHRLLREGEVVAGPDTPEDTGPRHPRTIAGLSEDGRKLILVVIDGRQPGWSDGATLRESALWLRRFGAYEGLNLDGGGSSTMVRRGPGGEPVVVNRPSGGLRYIGNSLGIGLP